jgi:ParB-like nuclease domain
MAIQKQEVEIKQLFFDPNNPRLPELLGKSQTEIFRFLVDQIGIDDVLQSIAAAGMIEGDPIIAREADSDKQAAAPPEKKYLVIEGNRRLAALKLLNGEKINDGKEEPAVPAVSAAVAPTIKKVTIQLGWAEPDIDAYLGYKHVTATREWLPEAKARFVIGRVKGNFSPENLAEFAKRLGTNPPTLRRWVIAFLTLKQAETAADFKPEEAYGKRYFGTFYTLLGSQQVQTFLGLRSDVILENPIAQDKIPNLKEFVSWSIGTKREPPIVNSRKQQKLDAVLASVPALQFFRVKRDLDAALLYTEYNASEVRLKLLGSAYSIEECLPKLFDVRNDRGVIEAIGELDNAYEKLKLNTAEAKPTKAR